MAAVVTQPTDGKGAPMQMIAQPPPTVVMAQGLPPGLAYLGGLPEIKVHQIFDMLEVVVGWERNNRYSICNSGEQQFMFAKEDTDCCMRQMCGPMREFNMNITDNQGQQLISLYRPYRCRGSLLWCCYLQELEIQSPPGLTIGTVKEVWTAWTPKYQVYDNNMTLMFTIVGDCCYCKCCADVMFRVLEGDEGQEIGQIVKHWGGCREIFGGVNDFSLRFPPNMDVLPKAILLGATFLIDFNYFEHQKN
ncbi:phospholipid scramblase 2-like [Haliotis rubra]|uniref:phospholipid scramblase 2-like n=1 Tax=Haliotis rubra TaxID=36100 RepID=UPI001EE5AAEC|nr:phospholipid scramblase 2-like [Haliotis rubra]